MRILLAEDDDHLRASISRGLRHHAYAVDAVADGDAALGEATTNDYDAIVLDVLMPHRDGLVVCWELRKRGSQVPVLMLTARDAVEDRIAGLDSGADDYLPKPFAFGELLARLRALLRRQPQITPPILVIADLRVDTRTQTVTRGVRPIRLTAKEYAFLEYLARNAGRVVPRSELSAHVWDDNHEPDSNLLDVYVSRLRRKIDGHQMPPLLHVRRAAGVVLGGASDDLEP